MAKAFNQWKNSLSKLKPRTKAFIAISIISLIVLISAIILILDQEGDNKKDFMVPDEPLKLGELQTYIYEGSGFSISFPSDWTGSILDYREVYFISPKLCVGQDLLIFAVTPLLSYEADLPSLADVSKAFNLEKYIRTPLSERAFTFNGTSMVELIYVDNTTNIEQWEINLFFLSKNESMFSFTRSYCHPDCWEYYKEAVYTVTSTYRFLD